MSTATKATTRSLKRAVSWKQDSPQGLKPKIHVDAYADIGGSALAVELPVVSADHLNYTGRAAMQAYARAGVVGVVMPGLDFAVRHPRPFDARAMFAEGMTLALATDLCPGCWLESMQLVMQLACRQYAFSPEEALLAATVGAAQALGLADRGTLAPGKLADIQVWDLPSFEDVIYRLGNNAVTMVIKRGRVYSMSVSDSRRLTIGDVTPARLQARSQRTLRCSLGKRSKRPFAGLSV